MDHIQERNKSDTLPVYNVERYNIFLGVGNRHGTIQENVYSQKYFCDVSSLLEFCDQILCLNLEV